MCLAKTFARHVHKKRAIRVGFYEKMAMCLLYYKYCGNLIVVEKTAFEHVSDARIVGYASTRNVLAFRDNLSFGAN